MQSFDWNNFFTTLFAAGFGAWGAYFFNLKQEDKKQKEVEKSQLIQFFYDISTITKTFTYHYKNTSAKINNLTNSELVSITPITIKGVNFKIEEYGFITKLSPKLYESLTYVHHDMNYIYEQQHISEEFFHKNVNINIYLIKLEYVKVSTIKLLAKLFVNLININNLLVKHYNCKNLIKDEVVNSYIRAKKIIDRTLEEYKKIITDSESGRKNIDDEDLKTIKVDYEYINEILSTWIIDFGLKNKHKTMIETEINKQVQDRWEDSSNDL